MTPLNIPKLHYDDQYKFRYYSRRILKSPSNLSYHKQRIDVAKNLAANEPLQGSLADMCYGCWFEMPYYGMQILDELDNRLLPGIYAAFKSHIQNQQYMLRHSELATRWSVLVTPSLQVPDHYLRISSDDARQNANDFVINLINAKNAGDTEKMKDLESEFLAHCEGCMDRIGFSIAWFKLAKQNWEFNSDWHDCQQQLQMTAATNNSNDK